jgi:hypothetical protein
MTMGKLTDILNGSGGDFNDRWDSTEAAGDFGPVPRGEYDCHVTKGELESSRTNRTPGYKIEFTIIEGDFKGKKFWVDCWLTPAALPQSKRDLGKLGITSPEMMERPLPRGIRCKVTVVLRKDDDGIERNRVRSFEVIGIDKPDVDPFAPPPGDASEPGDGGDTSFNPENL